MHTSTTLRLTDADRAATDDLLVRLLERTVRQPSGCLLWTGADNGKGYGRIAVARRWWLTHRLLYALLNGDPPAGYEVDHTCHTDACGTAGPCAHRRCLEPSHLEAVDPRENFARQLRRIGERTGACPTCKTPRDAWPEA